MHESKAKPVRNHQANMEIGCCHGELEQPITPSVFDFKEPHIIFTKT